MAAIAGLQRNLVATPPVGALRYGLFNVANFHTLTTHDIAAGVSYLVDHCDDVQLYDANCATNPVKTFVEGSDLIGGDPFWVAAKKHCGTVGRTAQEMEAAVRQQLISGEQFEVERQLWGNGGALTNVSPRLTAGSATTVVPTAAGAGAAIAALEEAAYNVYGYRGVIHLDQRAYAAVVYSGLAVQDGSVWRTQLGTALSFGAGYGITGPAAVAPAAGFTWAFMTAGVHIYRSDITVAPIPENIDRTLNQYVALAERVYAITLDCPETFAVQVPTAAPAVATAPAPV